MVELVDTYVSGAYVAIHGGSSPLLSNYSKKTILRIYSEDNEYKPIRDYIVNIFFFAKISSYFVAYIFLLFTIFTFIVFKGEKR